MRSEALLSSPVLSLLLLPALAAAQGLAAHHAEPRAFGYQLGDRLERVIRVDVPAGLVLDEASLPRPSARGLSLELQQVGREPVAGGFRLRLVYQVMRSPAQTEVLEIAPITLRFAGQPRNQDLRLEAWPITVAPLTPVEASVREGLGELRPDQPPLRLDDGAIRQRLWIEGVLATLLLAYLARVYLLLPWWARRRQPFGMAWLRLRGAADARAAFQQLHEALNRTAGEVLFAHGVERFVAAQPRYAALRADLLEFFQRSRRAFFGDEPAGDDDANWLREFCRKCRDAERGAA